MNMRPIILVLCLAGIVRSADLPPIKWAGTDISGAAVSIPTDRPSVITFVRPDQQQSRQAIKQLGATIPDATAAQVVVFVSGPVAAERAAALAQDLPKGWTAVADPEFAASGTMNIHVWPTTLVVTADGAQLAHLAGLSKSFSVELSAQLDFALGKIDAAQLKQRLTSFDVITDSPEQAAARHLQIAQRMLEQGKVEPARAELAEGIKHAPADPMIQLTLARIHVLLNEPAEALRILDALPAGAVPGWQQAMVRGRALIAQGKWSDAKSVLPEALKLNPNPAEVHYLLGLCFQHDSDFERAAEQFRSAYEAAPGSASVNVTAKP